MRGRSLILATLVLAGCGAKLGGDPAVRAQVDAGSGEPGDARRDAALDARACTGSGTATDAAGDCFLYHADLQTWAAASAACVAAGTHLAIITDAAQNTAIAGLLDGVNPAFIGATDQVTEGTFLWVDGTPLTFTSFHVGEPNNGGTPSTHEEDCLVTDALGGWDDRPCAPEATTTPGVYPFVCQL